MSLLALIAASATGGASAPVYDLYSTAMPNTHVATVRVGPARTYTTVQAGVTAANALRTGTQRALVIVDPGTYTEQVGLVPRVDLAGATGDPADVVIQHTCPTGGSPLATTGGPCWVGGMTLRLLPFVGRTGSGTYSIHHGALSMTLFEQLILDGPDGIGTFGMDGFSGSATWLLDCLVTGNAPTSVNANTHGTGTNTSPLLLCWVNCTANMTVRYQGLESGQADKVYVSGGSVAAVNLSGTGVLGYIDPAVPSVTSGAGVTTTRTANLPPLPYRGA